MRFAFTEDQLMFRDAVRELMSGECPPSAVRAVFEGKTDGNALWDKLSEVGMLGMCSPADHGGLGMGMSDLVLIIGVDQFARFSEWKEPEEVARMAQLWILAREGQEPADIDPGVEVDWRPVEVSRVDVSSSEVRRCVREGKRFQHLIPDGVAEIIEREGLYQD